MEKREDGRNLVAAMAALQQPLDALHRLQLQFGEMTKAAERLTAALTALVNSRSFQLLAKKVRGHERHLRRYARRGRPRRPGRRP